MTVPVRQQQPNLILVCADTARNGELSGRAYALCRRDPVSFWDTWGLLHWCERYFDRLNYPQQALVRRHLLPVGRQDSGGTLHREIRSAEQLCSCTPGKALTFWLAVDTRRMATWQGRLLLAERELHFASELELYRCLKTLSAETGQPHWEDVPSGRKSK